MCTRARLCVVAAPQVFERMDTIDVAVQISPSHMADIPRPSPKVRTHKFQPPRQALSGGVPEFEEESESGSEDGERETPAVALMSDDHVRQFQQQAPSVVEPAATSSPALDLQSHSTAVGYDDDDELEIEI